MLCNKEKRVEAEVENLLAAAFCSPVCGQEKRVGGGGVVWWEQANIQHLIVQKKSFTNSERKHCRSAALLADSALKSPPNPFTSYITVKTNFRREDRGSHRLNHARPGVFYLSRFTTGRSNVFNSTNLASQYLNPVFFF